MAVFQADLSPGDPHMSHVRANVEDVAGAGEQRRLLAGRDRAEPVRHARNLCRIKSDAFERLIMRQAKSDRLRGTIRQVLCQWGIEARFCSAENDFNPRVIQN